MIFPCRKGVNEFPGWPDENPELADMTGVDKAGEEKCIENTLRIV